MWEKSEKKSSIDKKSQKCLKIGKSTKKWQNADKYVWDSWEKLCQHIMSKM